MKTVKIHQLRIAAINGFLVYIDGKRHSLQQLQDIEQNKTFKLIKQDLRQWEVKAI